jgi:multiple sugar transport system ATP-binding protein
MIYVTHDQVEAMTMGSRICVMDRGRIKQVAKPITLYNNPANTFVGGFIGSPAMNLVEARILRENGDFFVKTADLQLRLNRKNVSQKVEPYVGKKVLFGIRPDHIISHSARQEEPDNYVNCEVVFVEHMGNDLYVYFTAGVHQYIARLDPNINLQPGEVHPLWFDTQQCHLFNIDTQENILQAP